MSDEIDQANDQVAMNEARSIAYARLEANKPIPERDNCLWCNMKTRNGARWCNAECRDMWEQFGCQ